MNSIRHGLQQFLDDEGLRNKIKADPGVRSCRFYRLSAHLPVSGRIARVALWGGFRLGAGWYSRLELLFGRKMTWNIIFHERYKRPVTPYVLRLIVVSPQSQADTGSGQSPMTRGYVSCGDKRMSANAMERGACGKELNRSLGGEYNLELRGSVVSCTSSTQSQPTFQASTSSVVLCWFQRGSVLIDLLYC